MPPNPTDLGPAVLRLAALAGQLPGIPGVPLALEVDPVFFVDLLGERAVGQVELTVLLPLGRDVLRQGASGHVFVDRELEGLDRLFLVRERLDEVAETQ